MNQIRFILHSVTNYIIKFFIVCWQPIGSYLTQNYEKYDQIKLISF